MYGTAPYTKGIDAIVISEESVHSSKHINKLRKSNNGLKKVSVIISPLITAINLNHTAVTKQYKLENKLSSHRIRESLLK